MSQDPGVECGCELEVQDLVTHLDDKEQPCLKCLTCGVLTYPEQEPKLKSATEYRGHPSVYHLVFAFLMDDKLKEATFIIDSSEVFGYRPWKKCQAFFLESFRRMKAFSAAKDWLEWFEQCLWGCEVIEVEAVDEAELVARDMLNQILAEMPTASYQDMLNTKNGELHRVPIPGAVQILSSSLKKLAEKEGQRISRIRSIFQENGWILDFAKVNYGGRSLRVWNLSILMWTDKDFLKPKLKTTLENVVETMMLRLRGESYTTIIKMLTDHDQYEIWPYLDEENDRILVTRHTIHRMAKKLDTDIEAVFFELERQELLAGDEETLQINNQSVTVWPFKNEGWTSTDVYTDSSDPDGDSRPPESFSKGREVVAEVPIPGGGAEPELVKIIPEPATKLEQPLHVQLDRVIRQATYTVGTEYSEGVSLEWICAQLPGEEFQNLQTMLDRLKEEGIIYTPRAGVWKTI